MKYVETYALKDIAREFPVCAGMTISEMDEAIAENERRFDASSFGATADKPIVLLKPKCVGQLDPETIMVDVDCGQYMAATVRYPKKMRKNDHRRE